MYSLVCQMVSKVCIISGKAAASYTQVRDIIRLITGVQQVVNNDPDVGDFLKMFFRLNYNWSLAEVIIPANDLSEQTSAEGMNVLGTLNMKFPMNGGLVLGPMYGAKIEIRKETGEGNMFTFVLLTFEIDSARFNIKYGEYKVQDNRPSHAISQIRNNTYSG